MPLRSSRFYLFGDLHYYGHLRLPRLAGRPSVGSPTFMRLLQLTRNIILPRVAPIVLIIDSSDRVAGFIISGRLTTTNV
jgi:hypothetical protein